MTLDEKDKIIFEHLLHNCRISTTELSKITKLSQPLVVYRIKRLESLGYISSYDIFPNITKIEGFKYCFYLIKVKKDVEEEFKIDSTKIDSVVSIAKFVNIKNWFVSVLEDENKGNIFENYLKLNKYSYEKFIMKDYQNLDFSIFDLRITRKNSKTFKNLNLKLDKIDLRLLEYLSHGGARDSLLEISQKLNLTYDVVSYRFKKLEQSGFFLLKIAQPSKEMLNVNIDHMILDLKNILFEEVQKKLMKIPRLPYIVELDNGNFFIAIMSTSYEDYKNTILAVYEIFENEITSSRILTGREWLFSNRFKFTL